MKFRQFITKFGSYLASLLALPYLLIVWRDIIKWDPRGAWTLFGILALCFIVPLGLAGLTKVFFFRHRPKPMQTGNRYKRLMAGSFPSMHTITVMTFWILATLVFADTPWFWWMFCFYGVIAILVMISRVVLKKHFVHDVIWGIAYTIIGLMIVYKCFFPFLFPV